MEYVNVKTKVLKDALGNKGEQPCYKTKGAAGADVKLPVDVYVKPDGTTEWIDLLLSFDIPEGWCVILLPRSSTSRKWSCLVDIGLIDSDYKGAVHAALTNLTGKSIAIPKGTRVAQLVVMPAARAVSWAQSEAGRDSAAGSGSTGD